MSSIIILVMNGIHKNFSGPSYMNKNIIILIEDDDDLRSIFKVVISKFSPNCIILESNNGLEAIKLILDNSGSRLLIISDIFLPKLTGMEIAKYVRSNFISAKLIAMTGSDLSDEMLISSGFEHVLRKDMNIIETIKNLEDIVTIFSKNEDFDPKYSKFIF